MPASGSSLRVAALLPRRAALSGGRPSAKDAEEYLRRVGIRTEFLPARPPVPGQQELELPSGRPQFRFSEREPEDPELSRPLLERAHVQHPQRHEGTLVWLHDVGEENNRTPNLWRTVLPPGIRLVVPFAPSIPLTAAEDEERRSWFDVHHVTLSASERIVEDSRGLNESFARLKVLLDSESSILPSKRIVLGGFTHGAAMAVHAALRYDKPLAGVVSVCGYAPLIDELPTRINAANAKTPILAYQAKNDELVRSDFAAGRWRALEALGVPVEQRVGKMRLGPETVDILVHMQDWWLARVRSAAA